MFKPIKILILVLFSFSSTLAYSQSVDGLKEIVKIQQDKISSIEDNLKKLTGFFEEQSNLNTHFLHAFAPGRLNDFPSGDITRYHARIFGIWAG